MDTSGLYIHIPFCLSKCGYCDFYSVAGAELYSAYKSELIKEIIAVGQSCDKVIDTVYIGGGTPSALPLTFLNDICRAVYKYFHCQVKEFTVEANPCTSSEIAHYKDFGIDRISLGVQSLDDKILRLIGRRHNAAQAACAIERAAKHFDNVSADLILGITADQSPISDIKILKNYVKHISAYILKLERGTPLALMAEKGEYVPADDDETAARYAEAYEELKNSGLNRYEISNFAREGFESLHNLKYWSMADYIGVGPAAHSFYNGARYYNAPSLEEYLKGGHSGNGRQKKEPVDTLLETIMLGLRLEKGINVPDINKTFGIDFKKEYAATLKKLAPYLEIGDNTIAVKPDYMLLQNAIAVEFF
ncbi:MAG: radical SAM family heme chaperone HemW [Clostridia bacterium]|nr:radical SAM family heme chaperone HemW [Clostridia bacterium]